MEPGRQTGFGVQNKATIWLIFHDFPGLENLNWILSMICMAVYAPLLTVKELAYLKTEQ